MPWYALAGAFLILRNFIITLEGSFDQINGIRSFCLESSKALDLAFAKFEFNQKVLSFTRSDIFENRKNKLFNSLANLQKALPKDRKIPPFTYPMKVSVLDWIEEQKEALSSLGKWNTIEPLIKVFSEVHDQVKIAGRYVSPYPTHGIDANFFLNAFTLREGESLVKTTLRQRDLIVGAFTLEVFKKMCGSNYFYPSSCELIKKKPLLSLVETLGNDNPFSIRKKITNWTHYAKKPFCLLARSIAFVAMGYLVVPIGTTYHLSQSGLFALKLFTQAKNFQHKNWEKMKAHISAAWVDASFFLSAGFLISADTFFSVPIIGSAIMVFYFTPKSIIASKLASTVPKVLKYAVPLFAMGAIWSPTSFVSSFAYRDERSALFKSITLRQSCGYTALDGKLLPYNKLLDCQTDPISNTNVQLVRLWVQTGMEIEALLKEICQDLTPEQQGSLSLTIYDQWIEYDKIIQYLEEITKEKTQITNANEAIAIPHKLKTSIERLKQLKDAIHESRQLIIECYKVTQHAMISNLDDKIRSTYNLYKTITQLPLFPYSLEQLRNKLGANDHQIKLTKWEEIVTRERLILDVIMPGPEYKFEKAEDNASTCGKRIITLFSLVKRQNPIPTPSEILELSQDATQEAIKKKYKKDALLIHPDKVPEHMREIASFFFKIIKDAYVNL